MRVNSFPLIVADDVIASLRGVLDRFARISLALLPTPLHRLERLSAYLHGPELWIKRDDLTGLGAGGNKVRKLEWVVGDAVRVGADTLVTIGAVQSNHMRQTAAAAARAGLGCRLVLERWVTSAGADDVGNPLLARLMGADMRILDGAFLPGEGEEPNARLEQSAEELRAAGRVPYVIPRGASDHPLGGLGYAACAVEIAAQADASCTPDAIVLATSSGSTQAGLIAGLAALGARTPVVGIEVNADIGMTRSIVERLTTSTAEQLGIDAALDPRAHVLEGYAGEAYGVPSPETLEAIRLMGRLEGIVLDPVYEGKALAGLIGLVRTGALADCERILFVHLGGDPAIHAYGAALVQGAAKEVA